MLRQAAHRLRGVVREMAISTQMLRQRNSATAQQLMNALVGRHPRDLSKATIYFRFYLEVCACPFSFGENCLENRPGGCVVYYINNILLTVSTARVLRHKALNGNTVELRFSCSMVWYTRALHGG